MTSISILGAAGRMGRMLIKCAAELPGVRVTAAIEQPIHLSLGQDAGILAGISSLGVPLTDRWPSAQTASVIIDFTFHAATAANLQNAIANNQAVVLGTTGHTDDEKALIRDAAKKIPIVYAANFSLGVNLLLDLVKRAAAALDANYDVEIIEAHHRLKKDAPSGTALALAQSVAEGRRGNLKDLATYGRNGIVGERPAGEIGIHAVRGGTIVGDHDVIFAGHDEVLTISHNAHSREVFAVGAVKAAEFIVGKRPGLYGMRELIGS